MVFWAHRDCSYLVRLPRPMPIAPHTLTSRVEKNKNLGVPLYLCGAYAYYVLDDPFMPDGDWEWLARFLKEHWEEIEHRHKHFITLDMLASGSFFMPSGCDYPEIVKGATRDILGPPQRRKKRK